MPIHLVSAIDIQDFGAETVRIGDLNGDGAPDLLFVQSIYETRSITCLTASTILGEVLWQIGAPSRDNGCIYADLPVQIYDWDNDGRNEVVYVQQATYVEPIYLGDTRITEHAARYEGQATLTVLDAATGNVKNTLALPPPSDDSFLFADLTGRGRREDLVVKDRYWNMWGVAHSGEVLWQYTGSVGHFPAIADVDGDGRDEVFVGFALIDHDGRVLFEHDSGEHHQDAAYIVQLADGGWRLLFGNGGIHCLMPGGESLWYHPLAEAQHVVAGHFAGAAGEVQFAVIDRGQPVSRQGTAAPREDGAPRDERAPATLYLYDADGQKLWRRALTPGSWAAAIVAIDWFGGGATQCVLAYGLGPGQPARIYGGDGEVVEELPMVCPPGASDADRQAHFYALRADVWGDSREEAILFGSRGACIYANARPLQIPTLYNNTLYPGM